MLSLSKRKFDIIWYVDAAIGVLAIYTLDDANRTVHILSAAALLLAAVGALLIGLFVRRELASTGCIVETNSLVQVNGEADISASAGTRLSETKQSFDLQIASLLATSKVLGAAFHHHQPEGIDSLLYSYSEEWLNVQQNSASGFYFEHLSLQKSGISIRRNILREATEMARRLQGSGIEVSVTPENQILLRDVSAKHDFTSEGLVPDAPKVNEPKGYVN